MVTHLDSFHVEPHLDRRVAAHLDQVRLQVARLDAESAWLGAVGCRLGAVGCRLGAVGCRVPPAWISAKSSSASWKCHVIVCSCTSVSVSGVRVSKYLKTGLTWLGLGLGLGSGLGLGLGLGWGQVSLTCSIQVSSSSSRIVISHGGGCSPGAPGARMYSPFSATSHSGRSPSHSFISARSRPEQTTTVLSSLEARAARLRRSEGRILSRLAKRA